VQKNGKEDKNKLQWVATVRVTTINKGQAVRGHHILLLFSPTTVENLSGELRDNVTIEDLEEQDLLGGRVDGHRLMLLACQTENQKLRMEDYRVKH
jgi:hypothetical protein